MFARPRRVAGRWVQASVRERVTRWAEREAGVGAGQRQLGRRGAGRAGGEREKEEADRAGSSAGKENERAEGRGVRGLGLEPSWAGFFWVLGFLSFFFFYFFSKSNSNKI